MSHLLPQTTNPTTVDTVPLLNAVMEATRLQQVQQSQYEAALAALRSDKEHTLLSFQSSLEEVNKEHTLSLSRMEEDLDNLKKQLEESVNANGILLNQARTSTEEKKKLQEDMKEHYDGEMKKMLSSFGEHVKHIHKLQVHILELEHWNLIQKRCWSQTGERSQLALTASHERSMITLNETRNILDQTQRKYQTISSEKQALEHDAAASRQAFDTEKKVLIQRITWLEKGMEEERDRAESSQAQLITTKESLRSANADLSKNENHYEVQIEALTAKVESLKAQVAAVTNTAQSENEEKGRLEHDLGLTRAQRDQLAVDLQKAKENLSVASAVARDTQEKSAIRDARNTEKLNNEILALRQTLTQEIVQEQKKSAEAKNITDELIEEKDRTIASLQEQLHHFQHESENAKLENAALGEQLSSVMVNHQDVSQQLRHIHAEVLPKIEAEKVELAQAAEKALAEVTPLREEAALYKNKSNALASSITQLQGRGDNEVLVSELRVKAGKANELASQLEASKKQVVVLQQEKVQLQQTVAEQVATIESYGDQKSVTSQLSLKNLEIKDLQEEVRMIKRDMVAIDAKALTAETRLHHSVQEGANTSLLLQKGLKRVEESAMMKNEAAETKHTLIRGSRALRKCLEEEGYAPATLPVQPNEHLDNNYLQEVLLDHVQTCTEHFRKNPSQYLQSNGASASSLNISAVPTALRTPMVYRSGSKHLNASGNLE